ncbi:BPM2 [Symbiodinium sp. KB8]|nr:BPM2 [Symbiodinium sp. KB8]
MSAEELRAEIETTKTRVRAAVARKRELQAATAEALERQRLRRELEVQRMMLNEELDDNHAEEQYRRNIDEDVEGEHLITGPSGPVPLTAPPYKCPLRTFGEECASFGHEVAKGEYIWKLTQMSWLRTAIEHNCTGSPESDLFQVGAYSFLFIYNPHGGFIGFDQAAGQSQHGCIAIMPHYTTDAFTFRYSIYAKTCGGDFVQWGKTNEEFKRSSMCKSYGPDVHPERSPPAATGLFGLSHGQLLQSEWVQDDTLTLKFVLEVLPQRSYSSQSFARSVVDVPEPTLCRDTQALLEEASCSDVDFRLQGEVIHAHSQVLCARSEVLKKQLNSGMRESASKVITIEDCDAATFKAFLNFLYTDKLPTVEDLAEPSSQAVKQDSSRCASPMEALWAVSHKYQVERLQRWCEAQLCKQLSAEQVCSVLRQAHVFEAVQLEKACLSYIKDHATEVLKLEAYADLISTWPEVAMKIHLFSTGVPDAEAAAIVRARKVRRWGRYERARAWGTRPDSIESLFCESGFLERVAMPYAPRGLELHCKRPFTYELSLGRWMVLSHDTLRNLVMWRAIRHQFIFGENSKARSGQISCPRQFSFESYLRERLGRIVVHVVEVDMYIWLATLLTLTPMLYVCIHLDFYAELLCFLAYFLLGIGVFVGHLIEKDTLALTPTLPEA